MILPYCLLESWFRGKLSVFWASWSPASIVKSHSAMMKKLNYPQKQAPIFAKNRPQMDLNRVVIYSFKLHLNEQINSATVLEFTAKPPSSGGQPPANKAQQPAATVKATTSLITVESISINSCTCVRIGSCATSGSGSFNTDGSGVIDLRVVNNVSRQPFSAAASEQSQLNLTWLNQDKLIIRARIYMHL